MKRLLALVVALGFCSNSFAADPPSRFGTKPKTEAEIRAEKSAAYKQKKESEKDARLKKLQAETAFRQQLALQQRQFMFQQQMMQQKYMMQELAKADKAEEKRMQSILRSAEKLPAPTVDLREEVRGGVSDALLDFYLRNPQ